MQISMRFTIRTPDDGPALILTSTPLSPGLISVVMSAEYHWYGAELLTRLVGAEPVPSNVCQWKLPDVVVLKLRP